MVRVGFISDTHGAHEQLEIAWRASGAWDELSSCKVVVHCGDCTPDGHARDTEDFLKWFSRSFPSSDIVLVPGNHDFAFDPGWTPLFEEGRRRHSGRRAARPVSQTMAAFPSVHLLMDSGVELHGLRFWGSPMTPWLHDWAFNRLRGPDIRRHWDLVPAGIDVLITHGPPRGVLDLLAPRYRRATEPDNCGCDDLLECVARVLPRVHAFGHVHEGHGMREHVEGFDGVVFLNASSLDERYDPVNAPVVLEVEPKALR